MIQSYGYRGYCTHNTFGEYRLPIPAQNILYRDYANKNGLHLKLSVNELYFPGCYLNLHSLMEDLPKLEGVLMCSFYMLPTEKKIRQTIYDCILESECELHFVLESIILRNVKNVEYLEQIFQVRKLMEGESLKNQLEYLNHENTVRG